MTELDEAYVPQLAAKARLTFDRHEEKHVLLYPERGLVLNESGAAIVKRLDGTRTLAQIIDDLCAGHAPTAEAGGGTSPRAAIAADVIAFVAMLRDKGLLREPPQT